MYELDDFAGPSLGHRLDIADWAMILAIVLPAGIFLWTGL